MFLGGSAMNGQIVSFDAPKFLMRFGVDDVREVGDEVHITCIGLDLHTADKDEIREVMKNMLGKRVVFEAQAP